MSTRYGEIVPPPYDTLAMDRSMSSWLKGRKLSARALHNLLDFDPDNPPDKRMVSSSLEDMVGTLKEEAEQIIGPLRHTIEALTAEDAQRGRNYSFYSTYTETPDGRTVSRLILIRQNNVKDVGIIYNLMGNDQDYVRGDEWRVSYWDCLIAADYDALTFRAGEAVKPPNEERWLTDNERGPIMDRLINDELRISCGNKWSLTIPGPQKGQSESDFFDICTDGLRVARLLSTIGTSDHQPQIIVDS